MAKLAFISSLYHPHIVGGAEATVQTLAETLYARGHEVVVITLAREGDASFAEVNGVRIHRVHASNLYTPFGAKQPAHKRLLWHARDAYNREMASAVGKLLDLERPDWVSTQAITGFSVAVWAAIKDRGLGISHTLHDYYLMCPRTTMYGRNGVCERSCLSCAALSEPKRYASRAVDVVVGISDFIVERHRAAGYFPNARFRVIHNASQPAQRPVLSPLSANDGLLTIGYIGRVEESKGIEVLLRAAMQLPPERFRILVAGRAEPEYQRHLEQRYPLSMVSYLGFVPRAEFYSKVDLVVVPSIWDEPFGMTAVEPLAYGLPVIVAESGGLPETIGDARCGWRVPRGDPTALAMRLRQLIEQGWDRTSVRDAALARAAHFAPARQADEFMETVGLSLYGSAQRTA